MPHPQEEKHNMRVHMDLFGPLKHPVYEHILVMTDAFSNYTELAAIPNKSAETVAETFFNQWICRHGCPVLIVTDGGKEFQNRFMSNLTCRLGSELRRTSPFNPKSNGQAEQYNKNIRRYLQSFIDHDITDWPALLPPLQFCTNTAHTASTKATPHSLVFTTAPRYPYFDPEWQDEMFYGEEGAH